MNELKLLVKDFRKFFFRIPRDKQDRKVWAVIVGMDVTAITLVTCIFIVLVVR